MVIEVGGWMKRSGDNHDENAKQPNLPDSPTRQPGSLVEFLRKSPLMGLDLDLARDPDLGRDIDLGDDK
jgi:hypothetical protein